MSSKTSGMSLEKALDDGIKARLTDYLKSDLSNMTAPAKEGFVDSIKSSILDSTSFREDVANAVVDMVIQRQKKSVWNWLIWIGAIFGWAVGILIAMASVSDNVKSLLLMLLE